MYLIKMSLPNRSRFPSLVLATGLLGGAVFVPFILEAGTGGVPGGCAFAKKVNGQIQYVACTGANLPMWYSSNNPTYNPGDLPCGQYGNQNCGSVTGDPLNE
jgi:hypothetical protein